MTFTGFEVLHSTVSNSLKSLDDAAIAVVHWNLISNGLKCCGSGDSWPKSEDKSGSELLPPGWNKDSSVYSLRYIDPTSDRKFLLKVVSMDGPLIIHLTRSFDEKTASMTIKSRDFVNDQFSIFEKAYTNLEEFNSQLTKELYNSVTDQKSSSDKKSSADSTSASTSQGQSGRDPLMVGEPRRGIGYAPPRRNPFEIGSVDPFSVGRADLDPLAAGFGGGMLMDPNNFARPGGFRPGGIFGPGPGFPPGSVPPGARFDPIGPNGLRPNPDPDHERPPGYDDMFM